MTFDSRQITSINPFSQQYMFIANSTTTLVTREGSLSLTNTLQLDSILVVPSLDYNLLSISQITSALSCVVIF